MLILTFEKNIEHTHTDEKNLHLFIFAFEPEKHYNDDQWMAGAMLRLLQTILPAAGLYRGTDIQLQGWRK